MVKHKSSLRKRSNKVGEITEPYATPEFTGYKLELIPSITTRIERLHIKSDSHRMKVLPTP